MSEQGPPLSPDPDPPVDLPLAEDVGDTTADQSSADAPRSSRLATLVAMGAVALALLLIWAAPGITPADEPPAGVDSSAKNGSAEPVENDLVGKDAPLDFTLKDMHGADVTLSSFKGKVILLNFWATWCGP